MRPVSARATARGQRYGADCETLLTAPKPPPKTAPKTPPPTLGDPPRLATKRLALRRPQSRDADALIALAGQWQVARNLSPVPHPYTAEHAAFFLDHLVPKEWIWALTLRGDDRLVGVAGLTPDTEGRSGELGYWLDPDLWGRGLMTEAGAAVTRFAFDVLGWHRIRSGVFADNPGSQAVLRKLGFVITGKSMRPCLARGEKVAAYELELKPKSAPLE